MTRGTHDRTQLGAVATEYVLLLVVISLAALTGMVVLGQGLLDGFSSSSQPVSEVQSPQPPQPSASESGP